MYEETAAYIQKLFVTYVTRLKRTKRTYAIKINVVNIIKKKIFFVIFEKLKLKHNFMNVIHL